MRMLLILTLSLFPYLVTNTCPPVTVQSGSTWIFMEWKVCDETAAANVKNYGINVTDITTDDNTYSMTHNADCRSDDCQYNMTLAKPCLNYTVDLVLYTFDNNDYPYDPVNTTTGEEVPSEPLSLNVTTSSTTSVEISWYPPGIGVFCVAKYNVGIISSDGGLQSHDVSVDESPIDGKHSVTVDDLFPCAEYQVQVTPVTKDDVHGPSSFSSAVTQTSNPGNPTNISVYWVGSDFVEMEWLDTMEDPQCIRGLATFCQETTETGPDCGYNIDRRIVNDVRKGRVNHLNPCTNYKCHAAYFDNEAEGKWIDSDTCFVTTWARGVDLSAPTRVSYNYNSDNANILVTWGGPVSGHRCVTGYQVMVHGPGGDTDEAIAGDVFHYNLDNVQPGSEYNITLFTLSSGYQDDVTGDSQSIIIKT